MNESFSEKLNQLQTEVENLGRQVIAPRAEEVDRQACWPAHSLRALAEAGLLGLHVPVRLGGLQQGLFGLATITETLGRVCSSSALCFGMHCVGTAVIAAKATRFQEDRYLRPIAEGRHITTLALSESGTGAHFYFPQTKLTEDDRHYRVNGEKQFVTNGGHADSYVISAMQPGAEHEAGEFSCLIVDRDAPGLNWLEPWQGMGMRGNSSRGVRIEGVAVPKENLLGEAGDQIWFVFEVVAPYFLMAMAGTYLGIAQAALDISTQHLRMRQYTHSGERLADLPTLQHKIAEMWLAVEKTRRLIYHAARLGDLGDPQALVAILACKADAGETAVWVTNEAMTLCGGVAYQENNRLARLLRDARASHVMSPTTHLLKTWMGRSLLGQPLL